MPNRCIFDKIIYMKKKAWIVDVNMGYGHQRTAYPLKSLAPKREIINANAYKGIPKKDRLVWEQSRSFYEFISKFKKVPLIGGPSFSLYNQFQKILNFYPRRDLSRPTFSLKRIYNLFEKGWGKDLVRRLKKEPLPLVTTFFIPAFMAEYFEYPGDIFCVVCDADVARPWAPLRPFSSRIKYFAPTERVAERLRLYGIKTENIFLTGFPLPLENIGSERLLILDPKRIYFNRYQSLIRKYLDKLPKKKTRPLTLMFTIGGAGAQTDIAVTIIRSLKKRIMKREIKIILVAGTRKWIRDYFTRAVKELDLVGNSVKGVEIIYSKDIKDYFNKFNSALRITDILWTKPSELSFYTALGLPVIIAPSIGSQEDFNKEWLLRLGSGMLQKNPKYTDEWLFDLLESGWFAEAAMQGFVEGEKRGVLNIKKIIFKK